jgi:hypothetical protein
MMNSKIETTKHIIRVKDLLMEFREKLQQRGIDHDESKLQEPEKTDFDEMTEKLHGVSYGSPEYKQMLADLKPTLDHHYANNSHHPEHYPNGINDMDLLDVVEMLMDWKASTERHDDGDIHKSIEINKVRFNMSDQLYNILKNTINNLNW